MKRVQMVWVVMAFLLCSLGAAVGATEDGTVVLTPEQEAAKKAELAAKKAAFFQDKPLTFKGRVEAVDLANRVATFRVSKKNVFIMSISEQVRNLSELAVGERVLVKYFQATAVDVKRPGKSGGIVLNKKIRKAKVKERPAGVEARQVTLTAIVEEINHSRTQITLKGPDGIPVKVNVQDPRNVAMVKAGDTLAVTYLEAVAISIEKAVKQ
jgi:hypothetical protein